MVEELLMIEISKPEREATIRSILGIMQTEFDDVDGDVAVYLSHLIFASKLPDYHEMAMPYLDKETSETLKSVRSTEDRMIRYFIFKVNADSIFLNHSEMYSKPDIERHRFKSRSHWASIAKLYYYQSAAYHKRIYQKVTGVGEVLQKLEQNYGKYVKAVAKNKKCIREVFERLNKSKFAEFENQLNQYERDSKLQTFSDVLLDEYNSGKLTEQELRAKMKEATDGMQLRKNRS